MHIAYSLTPKRPTRRTAAVMDRYGIDFESAPVVVADLELPLDRPRVIALVGESGGGKSSILRAAAAELRSRAAVADLDDLDLDHPELGCVPLVDRLGGSIDDAIALLARCGLAEARLLLRTPDELSDGQRARFRLAVALDDLASNDLAGGDQTDRWLVVDEFTATLDRTLAKVLARNVRRLAEARGVGVLVATTHEDILADLAPDVVVRCLLDAPPAIDR